MTDALGAIVRARSETYQITRPSASRGDMGVYTGDEGKTTHKEDLYLYRPSASTRELPQGEREVGDILGLALPSADVESDDRLTHGSVEYEVIADPRGVPDDENPNVVQLELVRKTN